MTDTLTLKILQQILLYARRDKNNVNFDLRKSMFHLVDNTILESNSNKMAEVMLLYDHLNSSFIKYGIFHKLLSIDESMVSYYERHSCKMFIRSKPIRFVYKLRCLCGAYGYPYHMKIYTGRAENSTGPLDSHVVNEKVAIILQNSDPLKHELFF